MKAVIADDEPIARQVLRELLEDFPDVELAGEAATGMEAAERIRKTGCDVVFLDLQMPDLDGFAVARGLLGQAAPLVVFVTAYASHALEAFDLGAVDYLLKPVRRERMAAALDKIRARLPAKAGAPARPVELRKIVGRLGQDYHLLEPSDVIAFQADGESVFILSAKGRYLADHTLKAIEERLPSPTFRRIHRQTIINTDHIRKISPLSSKRWLLRMSNGMEAIVSKRMAGAIREQTSW